jgi:SagB-type dehydrogenase family enzyme
LPAEERGLPFWRLYVRNSIVPAPLSVESVSLFLRYVLSVTAWKQFHGAKWPLRANPSSGNLHPTEGYVLLPSVDKLHNRPGVYHYAPKEHGLELRAELDPSFWASSPEGSFLVGLSSVFWREAWKYGARAFRYCQLDVGHAVGSLRFAAAALGWKVRLLDRVGCATLAGLLGLEREADYGRAEREHPELVAVVAREEIAATAPRSYPKN